MTDTTDIEALVAKLRDDSERCYHWAKTLDIHEHAGITMKDAADALERHQAVVEAATRWQNNPTNVNRLALFHALDAPPGGEG